MQSKKVIVLGSTGSIGTQALEVIAENPDRFQLVGIAAGSNTELAQAQAASFGLDQSSIAYGSEQASQMAMDLDADVVLNGITGSVGLGPTLATLESGKTLALANKESLIVGGELVKAMASAGQIVPVDSEHSAIAQCLWAGQPKEVARLILTASGGPFRGWSKQELRDVTPAQALAHPTWVMGRVVTTNSATLVNKGLELIEAHLLFDVEFEKIAITVHPQSIVHSMVEFIDGSTIAQCSPPDMRLPIALGMSWPERTPGAVASLDFSSSQNWQFEPLDEQVFSAVRIARQVGMAGKTYPAVYNASNEQAVEAFHEGRIGFLQITEIIESTIEAHSLDSEMSLEGVLDAERWARECWPFQLACTN
jgi:1-deoxy-D-xylulose-5-phosphate reductoisomerase